ncbi:MAG: ATP-binding cassette domain-containing protein [Deferribacteraceae bacterium]|jgi:ABC-type glutathione transport system ATPase component|nr:ATP-binding cassette domain-containing protein [Deferribacteraceae bacterium]
MPLLAVRNVKKSYRLFEGVFKKSETSFYAVDNVTLEISEGESLGIVGESGSGKTTLANIFAGVIIPDSGVLEYNSAPVSPKSHIFKEYRRNVQMIFQHPDNSLNPKLTVYSALYDLLIKRFPGREIKREALRLLERTGLAPEHLSRYPSELSGGQKQRVSIARALALSPKLIIADEPVSNLDVSVQAQIINLLMELVKNEGLSLIFISHNLAVVSTLCEKIAVIKNGRLLEYGLTKEVIENPKNEYTITLLNGCM